MASKNANMSIKKNTLWNLFGSASPMLIGLISVPYILEKIGVEKLGVVTLIWATIGYFSVFDFGLGRALTQQVSSLIALGNESGYAATARSGLILVMLTGVVGGGLLVVSVLVFGVRWLNVSNDTLNQVKLSILIAAAAIPVTTTTSGLKGILEGMQEFGIVNIYKFILGIANFVSPVISIALYGTNLPAIVLFLVASRFLIMLLHIWSIAEKAPIILHRGKAIDKRDARGLLVFGSWMTLSNLLSPLMVVADRFVISSIAGASVVAYYTVPSDFLVRLLVVPAALTTTLFPVFAHDLRVNRSAARTLYRRSLRIVFFTMLPVLAVISLASHFGMSLWLGRDFANHSYLVVIILSIGVLFNSTAQIPHAAIQANGDARLTSLIHLSEFVLYAPLIYVMVAFYGIVGAALAWTGRATIDFMALHYFARRMIGARE